MSDDEELEIAAKTLSGNVTVEKLVEDALDVVLGTQRVVMDDLIPRIKALEIQQAQLEKELQPQLIILTQLIKELTGRRDN